MISLRSSFLVGAVLVATLISCASTSSVSQTPPVPPKGEKPAWMGTEQWTGREGSKLEWNFTWTKADTTGLGEREKFMGESHFQDKVVKYDLIIVRCGSFVAAERRNSTSNNNCNYTGSIIKGRIQNGVVFCGNGGPYPWEVTAITMAKP